VDRMQRLPGHIFAFKLYCDLETGVRSHSRSSKVYLFDIAHIRRLVYDKNVSIYCRFRDIAALVENRYPLVFGAPVRG